MKKTFKLVDLDCANCAQKMEDAINKLPGVTATVSFMAQKLTIEADDVDSERCGQVRPKSGAGLPNRAVSKGPGPWPCLFGTARP